MILGTYVSENEELHREYKEFCFKIVLSKYYQIDELYKIIITGNLKDDFNHIIIANIYKYFDSYIPRYFCSFHNTTKINDSTLLIGINDHREVTGIPFDGNLLQYESYFNRYLNMILKTHVEGRCCIDVDINIVKCDIDTDILSGLIGIDDLQHSKKEFEKYIEENRLYHLKRTEWVNKLFLYKSKLESFLYNYDMRLEFIQFLKEKNMYNWFIKDLATKHISFTSDTIKKYRNEPKHIVYWLIIFKDIRSKEILKDKPIAPKESSYQPLVHKLMTKLSELRRIFTTHGIEYYLIVINFKKNLQMCDTELKFLEKRSCSRHNYWRSMKRDYYGCNNPQCIDM